MMHDNIYDVTFADEVTKKCYINNDTPNKGDYDLYDVETLLACTDVINNEGTLVIDEENKTATLDFDSDCLSENTPDRLYNYFQNSNLSAWKVWYCLDNDKSRFAWADDSVDEGSPASISTEGREGVCIYARKQTDDIVVSNVQYYAWEGDENYRYPEIYTKSETPEVGDSAWFYENGGMNENELIVSFTPAHEGTGLPNGRGVIYRLIDEFNNDCPYDFKNIQLEDKGTFYYLFSAIVNNEIIDCSSFDFSQVAADGVPSTGNVISMSQSDGGVNLPTGYFRATGTRKILSASYNLVLGLNFIIDNYAGIVSNGKIIGYNFYE